MTNYKYRVLDSVTRKEYADTDQLSTALVVLDALRPYHPNATIDDLSSEPVAPKVGDTVRTEGESITGSFDGIVGELMAIDPLDTQWKYQVRKGMSWDWYEKVSLS